MKKQLANIFFSTRLTALLFVVFAVAMACGTFIESIYSTETARIWIYNSRWFEIIMLLFVVNFSGNIFRYRLYQKNKWPVLLLHLSFILIIVGAGITRYLSYEGVMTIREGDTSDFLFSSNTYLNVTVDGEINGEYKRRRFEEAIIASPEALKSSLPWKSDFNGQPFEVHFEKFIKNATFGLTPADDGDYHLKLVEAGGGSRHDHYLKEGEVKNLHNTLFTYNRPVKGAVNIVINDSVSSLQAPVSGDFMRMADGLKGTLVKDSVQPLMYRSLYNLGGFRFVIPENRTKGKMQVVADPEAEDNGEDALALTVVQGQQRETAYLFGGKGIIKQPEILEMGALRFGMQYGSKAIELPFKIKLYDFIAEKYPGTENAYSSFMSRVAVIDQQPFDYDIYMNHILDHKGYRFFQASFDADEKGTVLSVNHDFWGTWVTYAGYFLLFAGLLSIMFFGNTRFRKLQKQLNQLQNKKKQLAVSVILLMLLPALAQEPAAHHKHKGPTLFNATQLDSVLQYSTATIEHANRFGELVIQDEGGRMKPMNTFASELLRKLRKKDYYKNLNSNQVLLSIMLEPRLWFQSPLIYLPKHNDSLHKILRITKKEKYARMFDFILPDGSNKIDPYLNDAFATNVPNQFQKDFKTTYEKLWLFNRALSGSVYVIFPLPEDENNKWIAATDYQSQKHLIKDSLYANFVNKGLTFYLLSLKNAIRTGDYTQADKLLEAFKVNQKKYGSEVLPSEKRVKAEIFYNRYDIFKKLFSWYMYAGLLMFVFLIIQIFKSARWLNFSINLFKWIVFLLFALHTAGLIIRWYISGHAPWSDAYESMIYVAWATMFFGVCFSSKSKLTLAATAFVTSVVLMVAHWNWMDPAIANLQPVLDSYWLMIHVAVIVGSYGPFTLGMILGITAMLLFILSTPKNIEKIKLSLKEISIINEMALTVGLIMLTIGNFLGGQWANESWGRYWGWDPKETWALISIMVYAFILHLRLIPGLRSPWLFNFASICAYGSIMMTYFGVNFYLAGLHSYASGDKIITPSFVYYAIAAVMLLGILGYWKYRMHYVQKVVKTDTEK